MKKVQYIQTTVFFIFAIGSFFFCPTPAHSMLKGVGVIDSFEKDVSMRSMGSYGAHPEKDLPVYHGDKFVTGEDSQTRIRFHDGSSLEVYPNSAVRIAENFVEEKVVGEKTSDQELFHFRKKIRREIRVLIGKIKFTYDSDGKKEKPLRTMLVAPTAAALLNGGHAWFGFDGERAYKDQPDGTSEIFGDVTETQLVPDISADQAANDSNYKAARESVKHWLMYENSKKELENVKTEADGNAYSIMSRTDRVMAIESEDQWKSKVVEGKSINIVGKLSDYAKTGCHEIIAENKSLEYHPEKTVAERARQGLARTKKSLGEVNKSLDRFDIMKRNVNDWVKKQRDSIGDKRKTAGFPMLVRSTLECASAYDKTALVWMLAAESYTSGVRDMGSDVQSLNKIAKECKINAEISYNKTRIYVNTAVSAARDDLAGTYLIFAELASDLTTANSASVNLVATSLETILTESEECHSDNVSTAMDELWQSVESKDELTGLVDQLEANYKSVGVVTVDKKKINLIMKNMESSAKLSSGFFYKCVRRISIVLSMKPEQDKCPEDTPFKCKDGSCVKERELCGCSEGLIRCWNGKCVEYFGLCPCPPGMVRCYDGRCVRDSEECFDAPPPIDDEKERSPT